MEDANSAETSLVEAAGVAGQRATDAFNLLSNGTRLAILVALWDAYDPKDRGETVAFSELYDGVEAHDSGNFSYHLDKLTDHFVEETADGYRLREAGLKLVQAVIAGTGLGETTLAPTEIARSCHRCGARVELCYEDEHLHHVCPECEGNIGPDSTEKAPIGTLMKHDFNPAGLTNRTPSEVFVAGSIEFLREAGLLARGVCPECSGSVEESLQICASHETPPGKVCPACGTRDEVRVGYACSVCKHGESFPVEGALHDHPAVVAFLHDQDIRLTYNLNDPEACGRMWARLFERGHTLVSREPVRIRVSVPGHEATLHLTLDGDLDVVDVTEELPESDEATP